MASDDDENIIDILELLGQYDNVQENVRQRRLRRRENLFHKYDDDEFLERFRLSKHTVLDVLHLIEQDIAFDSGRNSGLSAANQLLLTLRFYATGAFQQVLGDFTGVHRSTACRAIARVSRAIAAHRATYIKLPDSLEALTELRNGFFRIAGVPRTFGTIDCSHIPVSSPGGDEAELYRNRKGYFSVNVQAVADYKLKFQDIVARWHGSAHDSNIFDHSRLRARLEAGHFGENFLLGDGGYACRSYLLTPFRAPENPHEASFNRAHIKTRSSVERMFGIWKRRFPIVKFGIRNKLTSAKIIIIATAILHNIAIDAKNPIPQRLPPMQRNYGRVPVRRLREPRRRGPTAVRNEIALGFF